MTRFLAMICLCVMAIAAPLKAAEMNKADEAAIADVIAGQLNAFASGDSPGAYDFAAPIVKQAFPTVEHFILMVTRGYQPVYRNTARKFGDGFFDKMGRPAMRVVLTAEDGKRYEAIYTMEQQPDGTWKIAGCALIAIEGSEV